MLSPFTAVHTAIRKTFDFEGRSRRSEFWWFCLFALIFFVIVASIEGAFFSQPEFQTRNRGWGKVIDQFRVDPATQTTFWILTVMLVSLGTRRLHDLSKRGWPIIVGFICLILSNFISPMREIWGDDEIPKMNFKAYFYPSNYEVMSPLYSLIIGFTILLFLYCFIAAVFEGQSKTNQFGESPKSNQVTNVFD